MPCTEAYKEHIEYTFNAFCRVVIYYAAINAWRDSLAPSPSPLSPTGRPGTWDTTISSPFLPWGSRVCFIMVCMAVYAAPVQGIAAGSDLMGAIWTCVGTRCCCASSSSRPGASQNPYGVLTKILL